MPRGGGTGFAGGAVPVSGGVVVDLERMARMRSFDPLLWRIQVEAGLPTVRAAPDRARERPAASRPIPGAAEQSQIGGNIATNAGGPHAFKYGVTGAWVTGLEAVVPPGELISVGGAMRKDVAGYDLKSLLIGSEGTLGIVTAAWLRLIPAPEAAIPVAAVYADVATGCAALEAVLGNGLQVGGARVPRRAHDRAVGRGRSRGSVPAGAGFMVLAEADGVSRRGRRARGRAAPRCSAEDALRVARFDTAGGDRRAVALARRRLDRGHGRIAAASSREDVVVPLDRLAEAIDGHARDRRAARAATPAAGATPATATCTRRFLLDRHDSEAIGARARGLRRAVRAGRRLGGSISGEHGIGWIKRGRLGSPVEPDRCRSAQPHQADVRPQEPDEPRQEDVNKRCQAPATSASTSSAHAAHRRNCDKCVTSAVTMPGTGRTPAG